MNRDWEISREILVRLEAASTPNAYLKAENIFQYSSLFGADLHHIRPQVAFRREVT